MEPLCSPLNKREEIFMGKKNKSYYTFYSNYHLDDSRTPAIFFARLAYWKWHKQHEDLRIDPLNMRVIPYIDYVQKIWCSLLLHIGPTCLISSLGIKNQGKAGNKYPPTTLVIQILTKRALHLDFPTSYRPFTILCKQITHKEIYYELFTIFFEAWFWEKPKMQCILITFRDDNF